MISAPTVEPKAMAALEGQPTSTTPRSTSKRCASAWAAGLTWANSRPITRPTPMKPMPMSTPERAARLAFWPRTIARIVMRMGRTTAAPTSLK